jgi:hypothetical protein
MHTRVLQVDLAAGADRPLLEVASAVQLVDAVSSLSMLYHPLLMPYHLETTSEEKQTTEVQAYSNVYRIQPWWREPHLDM